MHRAMFVCFLVQRQALQRFSFLLQSTSGLVILLQQLCCPCRFWCRLKPHMIVCMLLSAGQRTCSWLGACEAIVLVFRTDSNHPCQQSTCLEDHMAVAKLCVLQNCMNESNRNHPYDMFVVPCPLYTHFATLHFVSVCRKAYHKHLQYIVIQS